MQYKPGSVEDTFSRLALERERKIQFLATLSVVNAIIEVGNGIVSAITQSPSQHGKDTLKKTVELLKDLMLPEESEDKEKKAFEVRKKLEEEVMKGPITFRPMSHGKKRKR